MKKQNKKRKFSRPASQRKAMLNNLAAELFLKKRIKTTEAKAKELRPYAEKFLTKAKKGDLAARRRLLKFLREKAVKKLVDEIAPQYKARQGGCIRIIKLNPRKSDGAEMAIIELV